MKKPITVSWMRYYVLDPLESAWGAVKDFFGEMYIKLIGGWYCEYCQKIHGRRVLKYMLHFTKDDVEVSKNGSLRDDFEYHDRFVCSLGHDAIVDGSWKPERPTLAQALNQLMSSCDRLSSALGGGNHDVHWEQTPQR